MLIAQPVQGPLKDLKPAQRVTGTRGSISGTFVFAIGSFDPASAFAATCPVLLSPLVVPSMATQSDPCILKYSHALGLCETNITRFDRNPRY